MKITATVRDTQNNSSEFSLPAPFGPQADGPLECHETSIASQLPNLLATTFSTISEFSLSTQALENFSGLDAPIGGLRWWGVGVIQNETTPCTRTGTFRISNYLTLPLRTSPSGCPIFSLSLPDLHLHLLSSP